MAVQSCCYPAGRTSNVYLSNEYFGPTALLGSACTYMDEKMCYPQPHRCVLKQEPPAFADQEGSVASPGSSAISESAEDLTWALDDIVETLSEHANGSPSCSIGTPEWSVDVSLGSSGGTEWNSHASSPDSSVHEETQQLISPASPARSDVAARTSRPEGDPVLAPPPLPQGVLKELLPQISSSPSLCLSAPAVSQRCEQWFPVQTRSVAVATMCTSQTATTSATTSARLCHFSPVPCTADPCSQTSSPLDTQWRLSETVCKKHKRLRQTRRRPDRSLITGKRKFRCETCTNILERHVQENGSKLRPNDRQELLKLVGMSLQQLEFWFSNRRRAEKQATLSVRR